MNILLVDENLLFREGMELLLERLATGLEITHASNVQAAIRALRQQPAPHLVVTDLAFRECGGTQALVKLKAANEDVSIVVLAENNEPAVVRSAIECGAMSYLTKSLGLEELSAALRTVLDGGAYVPSVALSMDWTPFTQLTSAAMADGDLYVLLSLLYGRSMKATARELDISEVAARAYAKALLGSLGLEDRTQLVFAMAKTGLRFSPAARQPLAGYSSSLTSRCATASVASNWSGTQSVAANTASYL